VLEAKAEDKNLLVGKEQARKYAKSQNCRFVILSNGNLHYFWDLERGSPYVVTAFPAPESVTGYQKVTPNPLRLIDEQVGDNAPPNSAYFVPTSSVFISRGMGHSATPMPAIEHQPQATRFR